ncbi:aryl sulfotransferase [Nostoc sp. 3335mG]|nr:aryl sulfotransferase [Nostoc sp. 3335mG]
MVAQGVYWLASYPKSGNTWLRLALACLGNAGRLPDLGAPDELCPNAASLEWMQGLLDLPVGDMAPREQALMRTEACRLYGETADAPAFLKIHDAYDAASFGSVASAGTVLIVRDPRDVAPSWADHLGITVDDAIALMARPDFAIGLPGRQQQPQALQRLGSWSTNVQSWLDRAPRPLLMLRYEDLLAEPGACLTALAGFTGQVTDDDLIEKTVAATSFQSLQAAEAQSGFKERGRRQRTFFRQGRAGAWRQGISAKQADRLWTDHHEVMTQLGYGADGTLSDAPEHSLPTG